MAQVRWDECLLRRPKVKLSLCLILIQASRDADYTEKVALLRGFALSHFLHLGKGPGCSLRNWELTWAWPYLADAAQLHLASLRSIFNLSQHLRIRWGRSLHAWGSEHGDSKWMAWSAGGWPRRKTLMFVILEESMRSEQSQHLVGPFELSGWGTQDTCLWGGEGHWAFSAALNWNLPHGTDSESLIVLAEVREQGVWEAQVLPGSTTIAQGASLGIWKPAPQWKQSICYGFIASSISDAQWEQRQGKWACTHR